MRMRIWVISAFQFTEFICYLKESKAAFLLSELAIQTCPFAKKMQQFEGTFAC